MACTEVPRQLFAGCHFLDPAAVCALMSTRPNGQHILFCEYQFADPLPVIPQLSLLAHAGHVIARLANGAQRAAVFGRQGAI